MQRDRNTLNRIRAVAPLLGFFYSSQRNTSSISCRGMNSVRAREHFEFCDILSQSSSKCARQRDASGMMSSPLDFFLIAVYNS